MTIFSLAWFTVYCGIQVDFLSQKNLYKLAIDFYSRAKIQTFITGSSTSWIVFLLNQYTSITVTPADGHKYFKFKLVFDEHIQ